MEKKIKCPYCLNECFRNGYEEESQTVLGREIRRIKCPQCSTLLPRDFFNADSAVISIVGSTAVGKTFYALSLINLFRNNRLLHKFGIDGDIINESIEIRTHIETLINQKQHGVDFLRTDKEDSKDTWVVRVSIRKGNHAKHLYLSFFDNAGEGFKSISDILANNNNILMADGLIFLFSPKELWEIFGNEVVRYANKYNYDDLKSTDSNNKETLFETMNNVIEVLKFEDNIPDKVAKWKFWHKEPKINLPIAFCISWYDVISERFCNQIPDDTDEVEMSSIIGNGKIKFDAVESYSKEIEAVLYNEETGNWRLKNTIETSLDNYLYFLIQTRKNCKDSNGRVYEDEPRGCLLPILWMFKQLKLI